MSKSKKTPNQKSSVFVKPLVELARLPANTAVYVADGDFNRYASNALKADLNIFPILFSNVVF